MKTFRSFLSKLLLPLLLRSRRCRLRCFCYCVRGFWAKSKLCALRALLAILIYICIIYLSIIFMFVRFSSLLFGSKIIFGCNIFHCEHLFLWFVVLIVIIVIWFIFRDAFETIFVWRIYIDWWHTPHLTYIYVYQPHVAEFIKLSAFVTLRLINWTFYDYLWICLLVSINEPIEACANFGVRRK